MGLWSSAVRGEGMRAGRNDHGAIVTLIILMTTWRTLFRFVAGRPMLGDRHRSTDATFLRAGTRVLRPNDRPPTWWAYLPEWRRAAVRFAAVLVLVAGAWWSVTGSLFGSVAHSVISAGALAVMAAGAWFLVVRIDGKVRQAKHEHGMTGPLRAALAPILGVSPREVRVHLPRKNLVIDQKAGDGS